MRKLITIIMAVAIVFSGADAALAQKAQKQKKSKTKKFHFAKLSRDVKKESKKYEKQKYQPFVGQPPIGQQLDKSYRMQAEADEDGYPKWIIATGSSVANTQAAGEMQAIELAKSRLVGLVETNFRAVIENTVSNKQLNAEEAVSVTKSVEVSANRVSKKLGMIVPVVKIFRRIDKNFEVQVTIGYNYEMARRQMLDEMRVEFEKESDDVRKKYERFLNPDLYPENVKNYAE